MRLGERLEDLVARLGDNCLVERGEALGGEEGGSVMSMLVF